MSGHVAKVVCPHDCPDTCVMTVTVEGERAVAIGGDPDHRFTQGFLCAKVNRYLERVYSPDRLLHPLRRVGPKGSGRFERISWDDALDLVAHRFREIAAAHGAQAILPYSYAGNMGLLSYGSMDRRFFGALGASLLDRTICASAGAAGYKATVGKSMGADPEAAVNARLIVAWGANIVSSNVHLWPFIEEARRRGAKLVTVDPYRSRHRREVRPASGSAAGERRGSRSRHDARPLPRRSAGRRLPRPLHGRSRGAAQARGRVDPRAGGRNHGPRRGGDRRLRAGVRPHAALPPEDQLRPEPSCRSGDGRAHHLLPARRRRRLARRRGRHPALDVARPTL